MIKTSTPYEQVLGEILDIAPSATRQEWVDLTQAVGRVVAHDITSPMAIPQAPLSAMDGYAFAYADYQQQMPIVGRQVAGALPEVLAGKTACRIFTGALIPQGADTVVAQEDVVVEQGCIRFLKTPLAGKHVKAQGSDVQLGQALVKQGQILRASHVAVLASAGIARVCVYAPLRVAILQTGSELTRPGEKIAPGQIYNANSYALRALLAPLAVELQEVSWVADDLSATLAALRNLSQGVDVIITTGGVSVGEEDYTQMAMHQLGKVYAWSINMRPGKPLALGVLPQSLHLALPGNPVAAMVSFVLFVRPLLLKMMGAASPLWQQEVWRVRADFDWPQAKPFLSWFHGCVTHTQADPWGQLNPQQGSSQLLALSNSSGLIKIPPQSQIRHGDWVDFYPYAAVGL